MSKAAPVVSLIFRGRKVERRVSPYLTINEAAALLRVTRQTIYNLVARGNLRTIQRRGRRLLLLRNVLRERNEKEQKAKSERGRR